MMRQNAAITGGSLVAVAVVVALGSLSPKLSSQQTPAADQQSWVDRAVHNFGGPINTKWAEGELSFADDGTMVFTSGREDLAVAPGDPRDLYIATFNGDAGTWNTPVNMGRPVNAAPATDVDPLRKGDDREPWITPDGNTIYFKSDRLATSNPRNLNDIFVTHKVNGRWSTPEIVPYPVSTDDGNEHCPMLLRDGKTLCFASARAGGYGSYDIWCSQQGADGRWQTPVNQGPNINTAASEFHFMEDRAGRWVYFTSSRPGGQGGNDIWAARSQGPNTWGPAVNLGPLVNTSGADMCPALGPDGKTFCWFGSRADNTLGSTDIYWTSQSNIDRVLPK
jgi:WD40-like Beta Propeller Repeat